MAEVILKNIKKIYPHQEPKKKKKGEPEKKTNLQITEEGVLAVDNFNLHIQDKEFIVLVGPSGCGKSTTLRMVAGLEEISGGELYIGGQLMNDVAPKDRDISMVFQNYALYPHMTVRENIAFPLKLRKMDKAEIDQRVEQAAEILDITEYLDRKPKALSGGQRQRVAIGRAIVREPKVLLMDEPLSNLDAKLRTQMRVELAALQHAVGTTTIYVTHDQTEAMTLGTRIVVMRDGKMQQVDTPANLYAKPVNRFVAGFIGTPSMNFFEAQVVSWEEAPALLVGEYRMMPCREDAARISRHGSDSVILGIRPENILWEAPECVSAGADYVEAMILEVELLGAEKLLFFLLYGKKYVAKIPAEYDARAGEVRRLYFDVTAIHLFDCDSEMRI